MNYLLFTTHSDQKLENISNTKMELDKFPQNQLNNKLDLNLQKEFHCKSKNKILIEFENRSSYLFLKFYDEKLLHIVYVFNIYKKLIISSLSRVLQHFFSFSFKPTYLHQTIYKPIYQNFPIFSFFIYHSSLSSFCLANLIVCSFLIDFINLKIQNFQ